MAIFDNCLIVAPDGVALSRCGIKKAQWYLDRNLATQIGNDPVTIQLHFEPSGRNGIEDPLLIDGKPNVCVVCGTTEDLTRHHIIPYCFIKHMKIEYKVDIIRDIFPLCKVCHNQYEQVSQEKRRIMAEQVFGVEIHGLPEGEYLKMRKAKAAALALVKYRDQIPSLRIQELESSIAEYLKKAEVTQEEIEMVNDLDLESHPDYVNVTRTVAQGVRDYSEFAKSWRKHFVETMHPKYMPDAWKVDRKTDPKNIWVPPRMLRQIH